MTAAELARICGVSERQVHYWASGAYSPGPSSRRRLLDLDAAIGVLEEIYTPKGVTHALHARHRALGQPITDALMDGRADEVLAVLEQAAAGAHT